MGVLGRIDIDGGRAKVLHVLRCVRKSAFDESLWSLRTETLTD